MKSLRDKKHLRAKILFLQQLSLCHECKSGASAFCHHLKIKVNQTWYISAGYEAFRFCSLNAKFPGRYFLFE